MMGGIMGLMSNPGGLMESVKQFENMANRVIDLLETIERQNGEIIARLDRLENPCEDGQVDNSLNLEHTQ